MKVSLIIPTYNAEKYIEKLLDILLAQTVKAEIIVMDSESLDNTVDIVKKYKEQVKLIQIPKEKFNHGASRDYALKQSQGEVVIFMTQDALPTNEHAIENLLKGFEKKDVAGVYGRQIAYEDASAYEKLTRNFNYSSKEKIWREEDIETLGVKSYFFSNVFAAYLRSAYEQVGGFDHGIMTNEDMLIAAKFIHSGFALAYAPDAKVYHSHRFTLKEDFRRNYKIGFIMEQYKDRLKGADSNSEGFRMVRFVSGKLIKKMKFISLFLFCVHVFTRLMGNKAGKRAYRKKVK